MSLVTTRGASQAKKFFGREHADLIVLDKRDLVFSFGPESLVDLVRGLLQDDVEVGFAQVDSSSIEVHHLMAGRRNDCLRVVISGVHVEHPVVLGLVPPNALLKGLRISESAEVQGLVGDGPERLGRKVVTSSLGERLDDKNQFSEGNSSVLQHVWLHVRRRPSHLGVLMIDPSAVALPIVVVLFSSIGVRKVLGLDQILDHDRNADFDVDVIEVVLVAVLLNRLLVVFPRKWVERDPTTSDLDPVPDREVDSGEFFELVLQATSDFGIGRVFHEMDQLLRENVVSVEEQDSSIRGSQRDHDSGFPVGKLELLSFSVDTHDSSSLHGPDEVSNGVGQIVRPRIEELAESSEVLSMVSFRGFDQMSHFLNRSAGHVSGWVVAEDVRQHQFPLKQHPLVLNDVFPESG